MTNRSASATLLLCLLVGSLAVAGCGGNENPIPNTAACASCPAVFQVGSQELTLVDTTRGRTLKTVIWYPTSDPAASSTEELVNAAPDRSGGPYPLILYSHGDTSYNRALSFATKEWARRGFVVVAPDHEKNTWYDSDPSSKAMIQFARPLDMSFIIDQMLQLNGDPSSFLDGLIDPQSIGMTGSSFGGHTTNLLVGATPNLDLLAEYCLSDPQCFWDLCCMQEQARQLYPGQRIIDLSDARVTAALPMVPDGYGWVGAEGMAKIEIPIMFMGAQNDRIAPPDSQQKPMYASVGATKYLLILDHADHMTYADGCGADMDTLPTCAALHKQIVLASTAFWMLHLKKDQRGADALQACVPDLADVGLFIGAVK